MGGCVLYKINSISIFHVLQIACRIPGHIFIFGIVCVLQIACGNHGHIYIWHKTCTVKSISISCTGQYAQEIYMLFLVHRLFLYKCNYANEFHMLYASKCIVKVRMLMNFTVHEL
jgi:hypothetical protein